MNNSNFSPVICFFQQEDYLSAVKYLKNLLDNHPDDVLSQTYLASAYMCLDEIEDAQVIYWHLLLNHDDKLNSIALTIFELARLQKNRQNIDLAISLYQQGWEFDDRHLDAYLELAECLTIVGYLEEAICVWFDLISWQPDLIVSYEKIGWLWQNTHQYTQAIDIYRQGLAKEPDYLPIVTNLAFCYLQNDRLSLARQCWQKILSSHPEYYPAYGDLGYLYLQENDLEQVYRYWYRLFSSQPKIFQQYLTWSENQLDNDRCLPTEIRLNTELLKSIQIKIDRQRENKTYLLGEFARIIADIYFKQFKYDRAIEFYRQALGYDRVSTEIYTNAIVSCAYTNLTELAVNYLQKLTSIDPERAIQLKLQLQPKKEKDDRSNDWVKTPDNFYEKTSDWLERQNSSTHKFYSFNLETTIDLKPPQTIDFDLHSSFYFPSKIQLPSPFVVEIPQARFYLRKDEASSAVITADNYLLGDLSPESPALSPNHPDNHPRYHSLFESPNLPPPTKIRGNVVVLGGLLNNIYFHWLFDILPRIYLLELAQINLAEVDYFLVDNRAKFQQEILTKLGINSEKILPLSFPTHIQADNSIVPSYPGTIAWMPKWSCDYLKNIFLDSPSSERENKTRLYISRNRASNRRLINEVEVIELLQKYDFQIINLELLSVSEQARLLARSEIIISPHGSGLSNLVFCQPETKIIEIFAPNYVYPCYWLVSNLVELDYYYLVGEPIGSYYFDRFIYADARFEDIYLNVSSLEKLLDKINII